MLRKFGKKKETPVALIHWGTTQTQQTVTGTLETITEDVRKAEIQNPSMIIVGEVVNLRSKLNWFEKMSQDEHETRPVISASL